MYIRINRMTGAALDLAAQFATSLSGRTGTWLMHQRWRQLLFAHWPVAPSAVQQLLPQGVRLDTFDGRAFVSAVSFRIDDVHLRGLPRVPGLTHFPEVNLRTYVRVGGEPGVWFLSLHCPDRLAMALARPWFLLPYQYSALSVQTADQVTTTLCPLFQAEYTPVGAPFLAEATSLAAWLTERYCYFTCDGNGGIYRCGIDHQPWPLQPAVVNIVSCGLGKPFGIQLDEPPLLMHYVERMDAHIWPLSLLRPQSASAPLPLLSAPAAPPSPRRWVYKQPGSRR